MRLASRAIDLADTWLYHDTLAAAYAAVGRFTDAVAEEQHTITMAKAAGAAQATFGRHDDVRGALIEGCSARTESRAIELNVRFAQRERLGAASQRLLPRGIR